MSNLSAMKRYFKQEIDGLTHSRICKGVPKVDTLNPSK